MLLDEPVKSMDENAARKLLHNIAQHTKQKTLIVSTHSMATLNTVQRIIVMERGKIYLDGPKEDVLEQLRHNTPNSKRQTS